MRFLQTLFAVTLLTATVWGAEPPALTFQTKPVGEMLEDLKVGAKMIGGPALADQLKELLKTDAEKMLAALDQKKSIAGYVYLTGKEDQDTKPPVVVVVPVVNKQALLDTMSQEGRKWEPVKDDEGLFKLIGTDSDPTEYVRFVSGAAYLLINGESKLLSAKELVPMAKLVDPKETAWLTVKFNFARMPADLRTKAGESIEQGLKELKNAPIPAEATKELEKATELVRKMAMRMLGQLKEANEATMRLQFNRGNGELAMEIGLSGVPGSNLAKSIAGQATTTNRFASMMTKDTVVGLLTTYPLVSTELGEMVAMTLEDAAKQQMEAVPPPFQPLAKAAATGLARTYRGGEFDIAMSLNGPSAKGTYSAVVGISFDDTAELEKEVKTVIQEVAPPEVAQMVKLDAAKVGKSTIHLITPPEGILPPQASDLFGEKAAIGLAFTPKSIMLALSTDPVATLKPLVNQQPKPARALDVVINSARIMKLATLVAPEGEATVAELFGKKDEAYSALFADLQGGPELKFKIGMNIKLLGAFFMGVSGNSEIKP